MVNQTEPFTFFRMVYGNISLNGIPAPDPERNGEDIFKGLPKTFEVTRYHSLIVEPAATTLAQHLVVTARTSDGTIMGLSHNRFPLHGVQFHPESFLTEHGFALVENFLRMGPLKSDLAKDASPEMVKPVFPMGTGSRKRVEARVC